MALIENIDYQTSLDRQSARTREILERLAAKNRARRDLADYAATVGDITRLLQHIGHTLGEAYVGGAPMPAHVLIELRLAQNDLANLIRDIEGVL